MNSAQDWIGAHNQSFGDRLGGKAMTTLCYGACGGFSLANESRPGLQHPVK